MIKVKYFIVFVNFKIKKVTTSHTKGECTIISENEIDDEKLTSLIADTGYELKGITKRPYEQKKWLLGLFKNK